MAVYASGDQLYDCLRELFARIEAADSRAADSLLKARLHIRFRLTEPAAEITIDARQRPLQIAYGPAAGQAELDVALAADTLHRILLGELSLAKALGSKLLKPTGPVWKTAALADLFASARSIYPQVLQDDGLTGGHRGA